MVTLVADNMERQWLWERFAFVLKTNFIRQPKQQLPSSSYNHNGVILRTHPPWPLFIASLQLVQRWKWRTRWSRQKSVRELQTVAGQKHVQTGSVTSPPSSICWSSVYTFQFVTATVYYYGHSFRGFLSKTIDKFGKEFNDEDSQCRIKCYNIVNYNHITIVITLFRKEYCHNSFQWSLKNWVSLDPVHPDLTFLSKPFCTFRVQYLIHCKQLPNIPSFLEAETIPWNDKTIHIHESEWGLCSSLSFLVCRITATED